jgi:hypothetical protein
MRCGPPIGEQLLGLGRPSEHVRYDTLQVPSYIEIHPQRAGYKRHQARIPHPCAQGSDEQPVLAPYRLTSVACIVTLAGVARNQLLAA